MTSIVYVDVGIIMNLITRSRHGRLMTLMKLISVGISFQDLGKKYYDGILDRGCLKMLMKWGLTP
jgi:hypothetical protein